MLKKYIIVFFTILLLPSCLFVKPVKINKIEKIEILTLSTSSAKLNLYLKINNPNFIKIKVTDIDLRVLIDKEQIGSIEEIEDFLIPANTEQEVIVKLNISFNNIFGKALKIIKLLSKSDARVQIEGNMVIKSFIISKTIEINEENVVSLFKE
ncbi:MAG: LEA type 2 family protein [Chlorobi bacterium]|nr:LEA type 2 family protein [Chlorobiota bacterium]